MRKLCCWVALTAFCAGCDLPRDPEQTLERVQGHQLRVGLASLEGDDPSPARPEPTHEIQHEIQLVKQLADSLEADVIWQRGGLDDLARKLERFELDLVVGRIHEHSPWKSRLALSDPYQEIRTREDREVIRYVLAAPPGENRWLLHINRVLQQQGAPEGRSRGEAP